MKEQPNFFAVIPANVRYDKNLTDGAKLLFAEITALSNKEGYCWANNAYFADLYGKHERTISRLISELDKAGHIKVDLVCDKNGTIRHISPILHNPHDKNSHPPRQKRVTPTTKTSNPHDKNEYHNNISNNISNNNTLKSITENEFSAQTPQNLHSSSLNSKKEEKEKKVAPKKEKEDLTEQEQEMLKEVAAANEQPTEVQIVRWPKPFDINEGVFHELRAFGIARQKRKAKSKRMTFAAWERMIKECQKASAIFEPQQLISHIENGRAKQTWDTPFWNGYQESLTKQNTNNHATTNHNNGTNTPTTGDKIDAAMRAIYEQRFT